MHVLSHAQLFATLNCRPPGSSVHWTFSRPEKLSGLPFSYSSLSNPGIKLVSLASSALAEADSLPLNHLVSQQKVSVLLCKTS